MSDVYNTGGSMYQVHSLYRYIFYALTTAGLEAAAAAACRWLRLTAQQLCHARVQV
jgi:2-methylcitrate dehydratase PrpD